MRLVSSTSIIALVVGMTAASQGAMAQVAATGPNVSQSGVNVLNLLSPFLSLPGSTNGQALLTANLNQAIAVNNGASPTLQAMGESDENLLGSISNKLANAPVNGQANLFGIAANLGGGLPDQGKPAGGNVTPSQQVGGLGAVLGAAYVKGVDPTTGSLTAVETLLNNAYTNLASNDLGFAKNYFSDGSASNSTASGAFAANAATAVVAQAPAGFTLPTANGLPNVNQSVYDIAAGVTNAQTGQDVYGDSRPDQVSTKINSFDPTALNGLATNPSFPSGHTTYAYTDSTLLAMLVPSEYQSMLARGSAYANSRIVVGVHYPLDIIGSRSLAAYDLAQELTNTAYQNGVATTVPGKTANSINLAQNFVAAQAQITPFLNAAATSANCGATAAACANSAANTAGDPYAVSNSLQASVRSNLNYNLPINSFATTAVETAPTTVGGQAAPDASILLATVYGGDSAAAKILAPNGGMLGNLSSATIANIIVQTEGQALTAFAGTSLSYWSRIDLYSAAGYFQGTNGTLTMAPTDVLNTSVQVGNTNTLLSGNSALFNANNAVLYGNGATFNSPTFTVTSGSTFGGGSATSVATTTINGNLTLQAGSTYAVTTNANGQSSSTKVAGTATVTGAGLSIVGAAPNAPFTQVQLANILTATNGITGSFAGVTSQIGNVAAFMATDASSVVLDRTDTNFGAAGVTRNEVRVGNAISRGLAVNTTVAGGNLVNTIANNIVNGQGPATFDRISGEGIAASENAALQSSAEFMSGIEDEQNAWRSPTAAAPNGITLANPLPGAARGYADASQLPFPAIKGPLAATAPRLWRAWGGGFGGEMNLDGNAGAGTARQTSDIYGGIVGVDYQAQPNILIGAAAGGTGATFSVPNRATTGSITGGHGALYATYGANSGFYINGALSFAGFDNDIHRTAGGVGGLPTLAEHASFGSFEVRVRGELGQRFTYGLTGVTPFVAVEYANLNADGFRETGATGVPDLLSLHVASHTTESLPVFAGIRLDTSYVMANGNILRPYIQAAYVHEFDPSRNIMNNLVSLPGASFLVEGARPAADSAQIKAGFDWSLGNGVSLFANFDGEFSGVENSYAGQGGLRVAF